MKLISHTLTLSTGDRVNLTWLPKGQIRYAFIPQADLITPASGVLPAGEPVDIEIHLERLLGIPVHGMAYMQTREYQASKAHFNHDKDAILNATVSLTKAGAPFTYQGQTYYLNPLPLETVDARHFAIQDRRVLVNQAIRKTRPQVQWKC